MFMLLYADHTCGVFCSPPSPPFAEYMVGILRLCFVNTWTSMQTCDKALRMSAWEASKHCDGCAWMDATPSAVIAPC